MKWREEYATGIEEIDAQHKMLLQFITEFEQAVAGKVHWNSVQPLIARTRDFIRFHFAVEESLMQITGYSQFAAHRAEHQYVVKQFGMLEERVLRQEIKHELLPLISGWLVDHIVESDKPFAKYALERCRAAAIA